MPRDLVSSVEQFMNQILADTAKWPKPHPLWFRGEPDVGFPSALVPRLFRKPHNALLQNFWAMASPSQGVP